jgi:hypothetical protein
MENLILKTLMVSLAASLLPVSSFAQTTYGVSIQTTVDSTGGGVATRLFTDGTFSTPAPVDSRLWFVADTAGNGLPSYAGGATIILGADDVIVYQDVIDGTILGANPGRYSRTTGVTADTSFSDDVIYAFLWGNGSPLDAAGVQAGNTFGVFSLGVQPPPAIGNASWFISQNMNGAQFTVVPEPQTAVYAGLGLIALALFRRRLGRKATV